MDSCTWTTLNVKQNLLKTKNTQNIGGLGKKDRCLYIYFFIGHKYNLLNLIIEHSLSAPYPYIPYSIATPTTHHSDQQRY